jgi:hypothetical protein
MLDDFLNRLNQSEVVNHHGSEHKHCNVFHNQPLFATACVVVTLILVVISTAFVTLQQSSKLVGVATTTPPVIVGTSALLHGAHTVKYTLSVLGQLQPSQPQFWPDL